MYEATLSYRQGEKVERVVPFRRQIVIGRPPHKTTWFEAHLAIDHPRVSRRHCVIRQSSRGQFFARDESANGTRIDGRRLMPEIEVEIGHHTTMEVAPGHHVVLEVGRIVAEEVDVWPTFGETDLAPSPESEVTILVGDIAGYTRLTRQFPALEVAASVKSLFTELEHVIRAFQGTIKEYQGDAVFAFWELDPSAPDWHAVQACRCALHLKERIAALADDPALWSFHGRFTLRMEWAITTGSVAISPIGRKRPGFTMVGEVVNYAFRLEKLAGDGLGPILLSQATEAKVRDQFVVRRIRDQSLEGFPSEAMFALDGEKSP